MAGIFRMSVLLYEREFEIDRDMPRIYIYELGNWDEEIFYGMYVEIYVGRVECSYVGYIYILTLETGVSNR